MVDDEFPGDFRVAVAEGDGVEDPVGERFAEGFREGDVGCEEYDVGYVCVDESGSPVRRMSALSFHETH